MRFRPSVVATVATLVVVAATARLGVWQLSRYETRSALRASIEARVAADPLGVADLGAPVDALVSRRVDLDGTWDGAPQVVSGGIPYGLNGYALVQGLDLGDGRTVLVNRGWIPVERWRERLGSMPTAGPARVAGMLVAAGGPDDLRPVDAGPPPRWPLVEEPFLFGLLTRGVAIPYASLAAAVEGEVLPVAVIAGPRLDDAEDRDITELPAGGYVVGFRVFHHLEYAAQWFGFGLIALGLWAWSGVRRGRSARVD